MFNMGGPIKQGIMHGIREPKRHGGLSKQFNTGLVGDERYPKTDGRAHHAIFAYPLLAGIAHGAEWHYHGQQEWDQDIFLKLKECLVQQHLVQLQKEQSTSEKEKRKKSLTSFNKRGSKRRNRGSPSSYHYESS